LSRKRFEQGFEATLGESRSTAQSKKPRVVQGFGHAHVAMSKLVQVILAGQERFEKTVLKESLESVILLDLHRLNM
jgi:hypothetical protein